MAKSRRKPSGCTRGRPRLKRMGKGWSTMRKKRGSEKPAPRATEGGAESAGGEVAGGKVAGGKVAGGEVAGGESEQTGESGQTGGTGDSGETAASS